MSELRLEGLRPIVAEKVGLFFRDIIQGHGALVHSLHITGSALTDDFNEKTSDINSVVVLRDMDLGFLKSLAPKGKTYRKSKVSSPLIMTPSYIEESLDVFPIEFLNISLNHKTVLGDDVFDNITIDRSDLRRQCERELKVKLIGLRQGYLSTMGDAKALGEAFASSITGHIPLFRGIIHLRGGDVPLAAPKVIDAMAQSAGVDCSVFRDILRAKKEGLGKDGIETLFERYYAATEQLGKVIDDIQA